MRAFINSRGRVSDEYWLQILMRFRAVFERLLRHQMAERAFDCITHFVRRSNPADRFMTATDKTSEAISIIDITFQQKFESDATSFYYWRLNLRQKSAIGIENAAEVELT